MKTKVEKIKIEQNQPLQAKFVQHKKITTNTPFVDGRPSSVTQRRLDKLSSNSPQVYQLKAIKNLVDKKYSSSPNPTIQLMPNWSNLLLSVGGVALSGAAAIGTAPIWAGVGGLAAAGYGAKGVYDNIQKNKAKEKEKLYLAFNILHKKETGLLSRLKAGPKNEKERVELEKKLDNISIERRKLIDRTIKGGHELWLPKSVGKKGRKSARKLWSSIINNKGNIKVDKKDKDFQLNTLSDISKLLQSGHARKMLTKLNDTRHRGRTVDIKENPDIDSAPKPTPKDGIKGEGSIVSMNYKGPSTNSMGEKEEAIYDPTYIMLGHELGHSAHYLDNSASWNGVPDKAIKKPVDDELWTSEEEYNNITKEENPMREQLGLSKRKYHKGYKDVNRIRKIRSIQAEIRMRKKKLGDINDLMNSSKTLNNKIEAVDNWFLVAPWNAYPTQKSLKTVQRIVHSELSAIENLVKQLRKK